MLLRIKSKKGLSIMIGYVLLVTIGIVMSLIVYQWIKTYVPSESLKCPDGVSVFIKETEYNCDNHKLNVTVKNNGRFNLAGYFIHATTTEDQELATTDLSGKIESGGEKYGNSVAFAPTADDPNVLTPDSPHNEKTTIFDLTSIGRIYKIEITPVRFQEDEKGRTRFASCSDAKIGVVLSCWEEPEVCVPDCSEKPQCGDDGCSPYDETDCGTCTGIGEICNTSGYCVVCTPDCSCASTTCIEETCVDPVCNSNCEGTLEPDCGTRVCGPAPNGCGNETACGPCDGTCVDGVCIVSSCNGVWEGAGEDAGVECDGTPTPENCIDCICVDFYTPVGDGTCEIPSYFGCGDYCALFDGFTGGLCAQNPNQCDDSDPGGMYIGDVPGANETLGNGFCILGNADTCCCLP